MRDERSLRELQSAWNFARSGFPVLREEAERVAYWLGRIPRATFCWLTGRHRWDEWAASSTIVVPPEQRRCRRCGVTEYRGAWPAIRVEMGSMFGPPRT